MVLDCVSFDCKMDSVDIWGNLNGPRYVDEILEPHMEPHGQPCPEWPAIFMQDGATPHTERISQDFLHDAIIHVMCPSKGPDLNIMENLWSHISRYTKALPERALMEFCTTKRRCSRPVAGTEPSTHPEIGAQAPSSSQGCSRGRWRAYTVLKTLLLQCITSHLSKNKFMLWYLYSFAFFCS